MADEARNWWEAHGADYQATSKIPIDVLYGPGCPNEEELQLIGPVAGKRVLELGCGGAQASIAFGQQGAIVTAVDVAASEIAFARHLSEKHGVAIDFHQRDMTDLTPIPAAIFDLVFSACAVAYVDDLRACFREVSRVLKPGGMFVVSGGHPFGYVIDSELSASRSYFEVGKKVEGHETGCPFASVHRTLSDYFELLVETGFVVDRMLEPDSRVHYPTDPWFGLWDSTAARLSLVPGTFIFRARKLHTDGSTTA